MVPVHETLARAECLARGRVQGVGYRARVREACLALGLAGYAKNQEDGSVFVVAEGTREALEEFLRRIRAPRFLSRVDSLDVKWSAAEGEFTGFKTG
ncbi:MAG: acylphosphatase [Candidatus Micrarchaeia archaeon]